MTAEVVELAVRRGARELVRLFGWKAPAVAQHLAATVLAEGDEVRAVALFEMKREARRLLAARLRHG